MGGVTVQHENKKIKTIEKRIGWIRRTKPKPKKKKIKKNTTQKHITI